jgi:hydroxyethylthiazole kinase-like uncharacterized protein yjeF
MNPASLDTLSLLPKLKRAPHEHKGHAGKVLIIGGDVGMSGAVFLAGQAALYAGAGWVILSVLDAKCPSFLPDYPELMIKPISPALIDDVSPDVLAIGPGLGQGPLAQTILYQALQAKQVLILDADALNLLALHPSLMELLKNRPKGATVLTPHPGEAARLLNTSSELIQLNRLNSIEELIQITQAIVVLKGQKTLLGAPHQGVQECHRGNPGMGVGGMGDVLTGLVTALVAQGMRHDLSVFEATGLAVELHSMAADVLVNQGVGPIGLTPTELILKVRDLINIK